MADTASSASEAAHAGIAVAQQIADWAGQGLSAPARLLGVARGFVEWAHYPQPDSVDHESGWKFYYHAHVASQRPRAEHGHFHIFVPYGATRGSGTPQFSHLIGLSVDVRGLPFRLFTTNRWVTDEVWQAAPALHARLKRPRLRHAEPSDVARWLENLLIIFADDVELLLQARDRRLAGATGIDPVTRFDDYRLRIPSQRPVNLPRRLRALGCVTM
ncbi:hypothetical protein [Thiomonas sp. FB-Cd]|uniref:DUF6969 family protein n=1 Tax=Thiomonas sp. FB-Cd TaxID=1158292 RepID=UPI00056F9C09|nr:hypothetical protein [Thiomonas sp. FB-Cd]